MYITIINILMFIISIAIVIIIIFIIIIITITVITVSIIIVLLNTHGGFVKSDNYLFHNQNFCTRFLYLPYLFKCCNLPWIKITWGIWQILICSEICSV